jgi:hypothetical protein
LNVVLAAAQQGVAADELVAPASPSLWRSQLNAGTLGRHPEESDVSKLERRRGQVEFGGSRVGSLLVLLTVGCATAKPVVESRWGVAPDALESRDELLPELEPLQCDREPNLRSTSGDVPAMVRLINQRREQVELIWLDYDGKRKSYGPIAAESTREIRTFLTHPWIIATPSGTCIEIRVPRAPRYRVTIR